MSSIGQNVDTVLVLCTMGRDSSNRGFISLSEYT